MQAGEDVRKRLPWWEPRMTGRETERLARVLEANYLNEGSVTEEFESEIARLTGARFAVATTSGTVALFLSLKAAGIGPGDEVLVPDLTFIATANAVSLVGATPVLVDIDPETLTLDPAAAEDACTPRTKAVMPVHVSGRAGTLPLVRDLAKRRGLVLVEDAAEALGSSLDGTSLGCWGALGALSFSPNKTITTGQGGMVLTGDAHLAQRLRELKDQGRPVRGTGGDDAHPALGFNFKLTNLQAAVGLAQLSELGSRLSRQKRIHEIYRNGLADVRGIRLPPFRLDRGEMPLWTDAVVERRDELDHFLASRGMSCRRFWHPLHTQPPYARSAEAFPDATRLSSHALWLPSAFTMTDAEAARVVSVVRECLA